MVFTKDNWFRQNGNTTRQVNKLTHLIHDKLKEHRPIDFDLTSLTEEDIIKSLANMDVVFVTFSHHYKNEIMVLLRNNLQGLGLGKVYDTIEKHNLIDFRFYKNNELQLENLLLSHDLRDKANIKRLFHDLAYLRPRVKEIFMKASEVASMGHFDIRMMTMCENTGGIQVTINSEIMRMLCHMFFVSNGLDVKFGRTIHVPSDIIGFEEFDMLLDFILQKFNTLRFEDLPKSPDPDYGVKYVHVITLPNMNITETYFYNNYNEVGSNMGDNGPYQELNGGDFLIKNINRAYGVAGHVRILVVDDMGNEQYITVDSNHGKYLLKEVRLVLD